MATIRCTRKSVPGALALVILALAQISLSSAYITAHSEFDIAFTPPTFPAFSFPTLPRFSLPQFTVPQLPRFLPPLPSQVTLPGLNVPQYSLPPLQPLDIDGLRFSPLPQPTISIPRFPGVQVPAATVLSPLGALKTPKISIPPVSAQTYIVPTVNPADLTIPGRTTPKISSAPTTLTFPPAIAFPRLGRRAAPAPTKN